MESQHGFLKEMLRITYLLMYLELVTNNMDADTPVNAIYSNFRKAFDSPIQPPNKKTGIFAGQ